VEDGQLSDSSQGENVSTTEGESDLHDLEQLLRPIDTSDGELMEKLNHETAEPLEGSRNTHVRVDFDENTFGC
jgi:hypothetical protein